MAFRFFSRFSKRLIAQPTTTTHSFSTLCSPTRSFRAIKSVIKSESDPVKIAELFSSSSPVATFRRHRPLVHLAVKKLAHFKRLELIEQILSTIISTSTDHQLNSEVFWSHIIILYGEGGMVDNAIQVFDKMLHQKTCPRTEESICAILSIYLTNKIYDDRFHQVFASVQEKLGVSPGVTSYNLVLKALCESDNIGLARSLLVKMENEANVVPNIHSYNVLLGAYLAKGGTSGFDQVVNEILNRGLEGNLITYNHRICRLCKSKEVTKAENLLDEMVSKGVKPNLATYDMIILWYCKVGDLALAKKVLEKMVSGGYVSQPSSGYFIVMQQMVQEGEFDSALETCREILRRNWVPPFEVMEGLINGLVKLSKADAAKEVAEEMKKKLRGFAADSWKNVEAALPVSS